MAPEHAAPSGSDPADPKVDDPTSPAEGDRGDSGEIQGDEEVQEDEFGDGI